MKSKSKMFLVTSFLASAVCLMATSSLTTSACAQNKATFQIPNGGMELDKDNDKWPDGWPQSYRNEIWPTGYMTWEIEGANHFLRLKSPGINNKRKISDQADFSIEVDNVPIGAKSLELKWRQRVGKTATSESLKAKIYVWFMVKEEGTTSIVSSESETTIKDTDGWQTGSFIFSVPKFLREDRTLNSKISIEGGTLDLDDFALKVAEYSQTELDDESKRKKIEEEKKTINEGKMQVLFDNKAKKLPPNYKGNNLSLLFKKVSDKSIKQKGQYEKTIAYLSRLNLLVAQAMGIKGKWTDQSCFATVWNDNNVGKWGAVGYNADSEQLGIKLQVIGDGNSRGFLTYYQGMPRMLTMSQENALQFPSNYSEGWTSEYNQYFRSKASLRDYFIKMSQTTAKKVRPHMRVLIIFRLNDTASFYSATEPRENLNVNVRELWFFNSQTGQVYGKLLASR